METNYKRTVAGSVGAGMASVFNASGRQYYVIEHKTESQYHHAGESQKIIVDQAELGRDASCQVRFDESFETVSRHHAVILRDKDGWKIMNLSKTNSTYVNNQPVQGEWHLASGDEIKLSSRGPVMGFIIPQGRQSMVSSIGLTERMNLFRKQALRPYKTALIIMGVILVLAVTSLVLWNLYSNKKHEEQIKAYENELTVIGAEIKQKDEDIESLHGQLEEMDKENIAVYNSMVRQLEKVKEDRRELEKRSISIQRELNDVKSDIKEKEEQARIEKTVQEEQQKVEEQNKPRSVEEIISGMKNGDSNSGSNNSSKQSSDKKEKRSVEEIINGMK